MSRYINALTEARKHFHVIGILGMDYSGVNTLLVELFNRRFLLARGMDDGQIELLERKLAAGDTWMKMHCQARDIKWTANADGTVTVDAGAVLLNAMLHDPNWHWKMREQLFELLFENQIRTLEFLSAKYNELHKSMKIPLYVELVASQAIPNYNDLVDEVLVITRPTDYALDTWYMKHFLNTSPIPPTLKNSEKAGLVEMQDKYFAGLHYTADTIIHNGGDEEEFKSKLDKFISSKAMGTVMLLQAIAGNLQE